MKEEKTFNLFSESEPSDSQLQRLTQLVAVDVRERIERAESSGNKIYGVRLAYMHMV